MNFRKSSKFLSLLLAFVLLFSAAVPVSADETAEIAVERVSGSNRYDTSLRVSKSTFDKSDYAVIASGGNFPDALVGGVLAGALNSPLLVTSKTAISDGLVAELKRLEVKEIFLLGGENTLTVDVANALNEFKVVRLAGGDRYETANLVVEEIKKHNEEVSDTYVADGRNFPDALAAAPFVAKVNGLLLLNNGKEITEGIAIGGENSVPGTVERIAGTNRIDTAVKIAEKYGAIDKVILVDAGNYPDALSAANLSIKYNAPILLTSAADLSIETKTFINTNNVKNVIVVGGENSVSAKVVDEILGKEAPKPEPKPEPTPEPDKVLYDVVRVVDGDTIKVVFEGKEESVRLIGIDTPESVHSDPSKNTECGRIASAFTKERLEGKKIELEFDVQQRDHYGRLLAYVWLDGVMFNKTLLEAGMAQISTYPPNTKYVDEFVELARIARENNVGLWGQNCDVTPTPDPNPTPTPIPTPGYDPNNPKDGLTVSPYPGRLIKGNITSEKIYHVPGQKDYDKTVIDESKGERWFATEEEAVAAGWRKAKR